MKRILALGSIGALLFHCSSSDPEPLEVEEDASTGGVVDDAGVGVDASASADEDVYAPPLPDDAAPPPTDGAVPGPDAAAFFGASRCATAGVTLCDGFEGAALDGTKWTLEKNGANTIALDTKEHARGQKSVRFHLVGTGTFQYAWLGTTKVFPKLANHVFGRIFYKLEKLPTKNMHWTTIEASGGPLPGKTYGAKMRYGGEYDYFIANYTTTQGAEMAVVSKTSPFPVGRWACLEWEYDRATDDVRLWLDDAPVSDVSVTKPLWIQPAYEKINLGWQNYQANLAAPMDVWMDEVALDDARIGCVK